MADTKIATESSPKRPPSRSRPWAIASVFIALILVAGFLLYHAMHVPGELLHGMIAAFRPHTDYKTEITGAIKELKSNPKLVVLTATIDAEVHKSSTSALWIYWGTTTVDIRARENKVQFYVPLDDLSSSSFEYDELHKTLTAHMHQPVLDEDVVDVQTDPSKIEEATSNGWAKLDSWSGSPMRDEARRELRNAVIEAAKQPAQYDLLQLKAQVEAKKSIIKLLSPLAQSLNPDVRLDVEFAP